MEGMVNVGKYFDKGTKGARVSVFEYIDAFTTISESIPIIDIHQ
jgi:hypothetical protein